MNNLKLIIALFVVTTIISSCSSDDDSSDRPENPFNSLIVGEWELTSRTGMLNFEIGGLGIRQLESEASNIDYTITFNEDGTFIENGTFDDTTRFIVSTISSDEDFPREPQVDEVIIDNLSGNWSILDNEIAFEGSNSFVLDVEIFQDLTETPPYTINVLDENNLVIEINITARLDVNEPFSIDDTIIFTYSRVN